MATSRRFPYLMVTDLFTHESLAIEVDVLLTGHGLPKLIICDKGAEFTSKAMDQ